MGTFFLFLFAAVIAFIPCSVATRPCRALVYPHSPHVNPFIRFLPPFLVGVVVIAVQAIPLLLSLPEQNLRLNVIVTRIFALANGTLWGYFNLKRTHHPAWWYGMLASFLLFTAYMSLPYLIPLQVLFFLFSVVFPYAWPVYAGVLLLLYILLKRGKLPGLSARLLPRERDCADDLVPRKRPHLKWTLIALLVAPLLAIPFFYLALFLGWMPALAGVHP